MCVDTGISGSTSKVFAIPIWNVFAGLWIPEPLGKTEVDNVYIVLFLSDSYQEIIRLDISVKEVTRMHKFNSL